MKAKVKGFTLIELIVVLAIFSIVLAAATSLMQPVAKLMVQADIRESAEAKAANITKYLEYSLGTAEYINTANFVATESEREQMVDHFVDTYYSGILSKTTAILDSKKDTVNAGALQYGHGQVHVMTIDNEHNGKISEYVYEVSFDPSGTTYITAKPDTSHPGLYKEYAVNKACYDEYRYTITPGVSKYGVGTFHFSDFMTRPNDVTNTSFSINAQPINPRNGHTYEVNATATVPLVNVANKGRKNGRPVNVYYIAKESMDDNGKNPGEPGYISTLRVYDQSAAMAPVLASQVGGTVAEPSYGNRDSVTDPRCTYPYDQGGMTFIYSNGAEMLTD